MAVDPPSSPADGWATPGSGTTEPEAGGRTLRFDPHASAPTTAGTTTVVLDTTWSASPGDGPDASRVGLREVAARVLADRDLIAEASGRLDDWAEASGVVAALTVDGTSFWYGARLDHWMWLLDELLWLAVVDTVLREHPGIRAIACADGADPGLVHAARLVATRDGLAFRDESAIPGSGATAPASESVPAAATAAPPSPDRPKRRRSLLGRVRWRIWPPELERHRRAMERRLSRLAKEPGQRLVVVQAHARQRIETAHGPRWMNPYLGPVVDRLRGTRLDPVEVDIRGEVADPAVWQRLRSADGQRSLPADVLKTRAAISRAAATSEADRIAGAIADGSTPLVVAGVDIGPALTARVAARGQRMAFHAVYDVPRIRALLRRLRPAGILLADEYHRQDWLAAAAAEGIPAAAVQHGVIYRWHTGYIHRQRPAALRVPDRTYVFGAWERTLLTATSIYRPEEVVVGGSPRLDLVEPTPVDRDTVRHELGIAPGDRLVVLSGTWGRMYRRFHYPIALASLFDRPVERVHLVVKLHPSERDEGPYRAIVDGLAASGGFPPPTITTVQDIDLYRLLAAADAHLGIHSTVLTEAVATATPNLIATGLAAADLLGYVDAGVAIPVGDANDLAAALDRPREEAMRPEDRLAFLRAHFEPGVAGQRIANDLLDWLP